MGGDRAGPAPALEADSENLKINLSLFSFPLEEMLSAFRQDNQEEGRGSQGTCRSRWDTPTPKIAGTVESPLRGRGRRKVNGLWSALGKSPLSPKKAQDRKRGECWQREVHPRCGSDFAWRGCRDARAQGGAPRRWV